MQINKILIIESPVRLWKLLESKDEIIDQAPSEIYESIILFMDSTEGYVRGCKCDQEQNYALMLDRYELMKSDKVVEHLIKGFECDRIEFK